MSLKPGNSEKNWDQPVSKAWESEEIRKEEDTYFEVTTAHHYTLIGIKRF